MSTMDFWEREIIIVHRQQNPASYGFYFPAKYGAEEEACINRKTVGDSLIWYWAYINICTIPLDKKNILDRANSKCSYFSHVRYRSMKNEFPTFVGNEFPFHL